MSECGRIFPHDVGGYAVCFGVPGVILILLLVGIIICCAGVCVYRRRRKRGVLDVHNERPAGSETIEMAATPIDLATGQMNQQDTKISAARKDSWMSIEKNTDSDEMTKSYTNKKSDYVYHKMDSDLKLQTQPPILPPLRDKTMSVGHHEQTTSLSSERKHSSLVSSANSSKLLVVSNELSSDSQAHPTVLKKNDNVNTVQENPQQGEKEEDSTTYDDIVATLEMSQVHSPNQQPGSTEEHKYHILCDPNEEKTSNDMTTSHQCKNKEIDDASFRPRQNTPTTKTTTNPQQRSKHYYEDVPADHNIKRASKDNLDETQDRYNVLSSQLDMAQVQSGIIQEDPAGSPVEDSYYCTTRVHRLVPVGKPIGPQVSDHLYQSLEERKRRDYDLVHSRHNTITGSTDALAHHRSNDNLVRSYTSTTQSLEKLDPMYDEPYKPHKSSSLSKLDIYNVESLFDDPKYVTNKISTQPGSPKMFDDPAYSTKAAATDSRTVSQTTDRHVSFSADTKMGLEHSQEKSGVRPAAARKTN